MTRRATPRRRVLAVASLVLAAAVVFWVYTKRLPFVEGYRFQAVVASTNQLKDGAPVRIGGVQVGEVVDLRSGPGDLATIVMELEDRGRPVHRDARLRVRARLFLEGGYYVELRPGSPSAPELPDGGVIPLERTALPVSFTQVLSLLDADLRRAMTETIGELADGFDDGGARALALSARPLGTLARDGAVVAEAVRGQRVDDLPALVRDTGRITAALASRRGELEQLVADLDDATAAFAARRDEVGESLREADATLAVAPAALRAVDRALPPARRFVRGLRPSLRRAPAVLDDLNPALTQVRGLLGPRELPRLLELLDPSVRRLPALVPELTELLGLVRPVTDCVERQVLPVLTASVQDGRHTTGQPIWQELAHSLTSFAGGVSGFDGNGHHGRVLAAIGEQVVQLGGLSAEGLVARTSATRIGSRPTPLKPGVSTPFRPDLPCRDQAKVDLQARTDGIPRSTRRARLAPRSATVAPAEALRRARATLRKAVQDR